MHVYLSACLLVSALALPDQHGNELDLRSQGRPVAIVFLGVDCPLAKLYATSLNELALRYGSDVQFVAINSNAQDTPAEIKQFAEDHHLVFPFLKDTASQAAAEFAATRTPEAVLLGNCGEVRYRGRIDDQYVPGGRKPAASTNYLADAIDAVLSGGTVAVTETEPVGCFIDRRSNPPAVVTYKNVAPLFYKHCVECHRPGQVAPFSLTDYQETVGWTATIREVIEQKRMPPWGAEPGHGDFGNDRSLPARDKKLIVQWIEDGSLEGEPITLPTLPLPGSWEIGDPDIVRQMPAAFELPATGLLDLQTYVIDPEFSEDTWVQAVEILPSNRSVVHHATIYLRPKGASEMYSPGTLGSFYLAMYIPGQGPTTWPAGMAKRVPAGWEFVLELHYVTNGSPQKDQTKIGLKLADRSDVRKEVATKILMNLDMVLPPHAANHIVQGEWKLDKDLQLVALFPHMHLRGKSMRFEAIHPDGTAEVLLNVPKYDFFWQHRYVLASPKLLPSGTVLRCTGVFDNSVDNPNNPDPGAEVRYGNLTTDEMFHGHFELCLAGEDLHYTALDRLIERANVYKPWVILLGLVGIAGVFGRSMLRNK